MESEFPVLSTPVLALLSPGTSQEKDISFIRPHCQVSLSSLSSLSLSLSPPFRPSLFALLDAPKPPAEDPFIMPDEFAIPEAEGPGRAKRSPINTNRVGGLNVETLVVADRKMLEKHGRDNVTTYVLTVMNMVRAEQGKLSKDHYDMQNKGHMSIEGSLVSSKAGKLSMDFRV